MSKAFYTFSFTIGFCHGCGLVVGVVVDGLDWWSQVLLILMCVWYCSMDYIAVFQTQKLLSVFLFYVLFSYFISDVFLYAL